MKNKFKTKIITKGGQSEIERLTKIANYESRQERDRNLTSEIEKLSSKRKLQGDRQVFKNDEEFEKAGLEILKKYNATKPEEKWFLGLVKSEK